MDLTLIVATLKWSGWEKCVRSWFPTEDVTSGAHLHLIHSAEGHLSILQAYQQGLKSTSSPILGYVHDDVIVRDEEWFARVIKEFDDPGVGMVGFGGALRHGSTSLYQKPYRLAQLGRSDFRSNMFDAERHGKRFTRACDVAVLDGFAMFVRREILEKAGGWPVGTPIGYFCYDYWLSCEVRRQGYRIRLVGVACTHLGGKSSSAVQVMESPQDAHRHIYDTCRDVLPFKVSP
ncbi:MAG: glycosyltransferase [Silvibacterium sp.]